MKIAAWIDNFSDCTPLTSELSRGGTLFLARTGHRFDTSIWENGIRQREACVQPSYRFWIWHVTWLKVMRLAAMLKWSARREN